MEPVFRRFPRVWINGASFQVAPYVRALARGGVVFY